MRRSTAVLWLATATYLLAACGASATDAGVESAPGARGSGTPTAPTARPTAAHSPTAPAPSEAADVGALAIPFGPGQRFAKNEGAWDLVLRDVRVGEHDGFDRVVVEFEGTGTPGWGAQYVRTPRAEGSGEVVDVRGDHFLGVSISGVIIRRGYPETPADFFDGPRHFAPEHGGDVEDVSVGGVFEGYSQLFLGIDGDDRARFRVFALTNPSRLVVDVEDA